MADSPASLEQQLLFNDRLRGSGMTAQRARDRLIQRLREQGIRNEKILAVMRYMPRHIFIDEAMASRAYDNNALPIKYNQTISQPYIVACMTEILLSQGSIKRVLEIGTGCGYQTAILATLIPQVYTIERINALSIEAQQHLQELNIHNVCFRHGDGYLGWQDHAPFDGIIVTAAPPALPPVLLEQLAISGVMVVPVGKQLQFQVLQRVLRARQGYDIQDIESVSFVPMVEGRNG